MKRLSFANSANLFGRQCLLLIVAILALTACSGGSDTSPFSPTGDFELLSLKENLQLVEGDTTGLSVPITISRRNGHNLPVELQIQGQTDADEAFVSTTFSNSTLTLGNDTSDVSLQLLIADLPLMTHERDFIVTATDGRDQDQLLLNITVQPVNAPDVYLLIGQSNMVGFSGDGTRQSGAGEPDESQARIKQLNVTSNDSFNIFVEQADFQNTQTIATQPYIVEAQDPLHLPLDLNNGPVKSEQYIGLGLSFAKQAIKNTTQDIILVPAAWSGSAFCANPDGPNGHWNAQETGNALLGNTWLFERAVARTNLALQQSNGILRGILWHQGESDSTPNCAPLYAANLERLAFQLRLSITADQRGGDLRRPTSRIPFVAGTMSRGIDERGDLSQFSSAKQLVDNAHRNLPNQVNASAYSNHDDLTPANGYPCGNTTCVHFGAEALREMGVRYYEALQRALVQ